MNSKNRRIYGIICTLLGGFAWGFSACFGQYLFENVAIETEWLITFRLLIAGTLFTTIGIVTRGKQTFAIFKNRRDTFTLVMFGLLGMMMCQYTFYATIKLSNAGTAAVLQSLGTIFILLIVCMRKRQLPRLKQLIAIVLAIFGVVLLNTNGDFSTITMSKAVLFYGLCSALGVGFYSMLSEGIIRKYGLYSVAGLGMIIGGLAILPFSRPWETYVPITVPLVVGMFGVIILGTAIAFGFYLKGVSIVGSLMGSLLGAMEPVSAVVISAVILKSNFTAVELIAFALIIGNVFWLCLQERTPKNKKISKT